MKRDPDPPKILGIRMTKNIVQCVALALETFNRCFPLFQVLSREYGFRRFHFHDAAIRPGHYFFIGPVSQPAAAMLIGEVIRRQGDPGQNVADIDVIGKAEMDKYLNDIPLPGDGRAGQLFFRQTKKGI